MKFSLPLKNFSSVASVVTMSLFLAGCPDKPVPRAVQTQPAAEATNIPVTTAISVYFDRAMNADSLAAEGSIQMVQAGSTTEVRGTVTYDAENHIARFQPASTLNFSTQYQVTVTTAVTSAEGRPLAADVMWTFTTAANPDRTPPTVLAYRPANGTTDVAPDTVVEVEFSEPIDNSSANLRRISLIDNTTSELVETRKMCAGAICYLTAVSSLAPNSSHTIIVEPGLTDLAGNALVRTASSILESSFRTGARQWLGSQLVVNSPNEAELPIFIFRTTLAGENDVPVLMGSQAGVNIVVSAYDSTTNTLTTPEIIASRGAISVALQDIVGNRNGDVAALYQEEDAPSSGRFLLKARVRLAGTSVWTTARTLGAINNGAMARSIATNDGSFVVTWSGNNLCFVTAWNAASRDWQLTANTLATESGACNPTFIDLADDGTVYILTRESDSSSTIRLADWRRRPGTSWEKFAISSSMPRLTSVAMDVAGDGSLVRTLGTPVVGASTRTLSVQFFNQSTGTWSTPVSMLTAPLAISTGPQVVAGPQNTGVVFWGEADSSTRVDTSAGVFSQATPTFTPRSLAFDGARNAPYQMLGDRYGNAMILADSEFGMQYFRYNTRDRAWEHPGAIVLLENAAGERIDSVHTAFSHSGRGHAFLQTFEGSRVRIYYNELR